MFRTFKYLLAATALTAGGSAYAQTAIQSFSGGTLFPSFSGGADTVGFAFSTNSNLQVTSLGWYSTDGSLASAHQVGIWNSGGSLLGTSTVLPDILPGGVGFRFSAVTPFNLATGQTYFVGGLDTGADGDDYLTSVSNLVTAPQITFIGSAVASGTGFSFPSSINNVTTGGRFGANFQFTDLGVGVVPEPGTWSLLILGFGAMGAAMRRQNKTRARVAFA